MEKLKEAHEELNEALKFIDKACNLLIEEDSIVHKPKITKLGMAIAEILHTQKLLKDDNPHIQK